MSNDRTPVIASAARTAIGSFGGTLARMPAPDLGAAAIRAAVRRAGIEPGSIDEVFMGCVVPAGLGQAPARQAAIKAGLPPSVGAVTLNKVCGSGLKTVMVAAGLIKAGDGDIYVAGGMENMNLAPYLLLQGRTGYRLGHGHVVWRQPRGAGSVRPGEPSQGSGSSGRGSFCRGDHPRRGAAAQEGTPHL